MASEQDTQDTGTDLLRVQSESETGQHPLDIIVAVAALTQKVNEKVNAGNLTETIEIAKSMGLKEIEELDRLVKISGSIRIVEPSTNGDGGFSDAEQNLEVVAAGQADANPIGKYSDQFKEMPEYQLRNGKPSQSKIFHDAIVQFFDKKYEEADSVEVKPSAGDKGSALSALVRLMEDDSGIDIDLDAINVTAKHDVLNRLGACGYLDVERVVVGDKNYQRIVAIRLGTSCAEDVKKILKS